MNVQRLDEHTIGLLDLNMVLCELLHQIVPSAEPGDDPAANARLFPSPTGGTEAEFDGEWRSYVEPGLRELFQSHLDIVKSDLSELPRGASDELYSLRIPVAHLEHWIGALNQARLALASRHDFGEKEMESSPPLNEARGLVLFQIHIYGLLLDWFLRELGY